MQRRFSPVKDVNNVEATQLINRRNAVLLDVREPKEFEGGRLPGAIHIPLSQLPGRVSELAQVRRATGRRVLRHRAAEPDGGRRAREGRIQGDLQPPRRHRRVEEGRPAGGEVSVADGTPTITMYTTATCPFCIRAERYLGAKGVTAIAKIRVDLDPASGWR